ncbi:hypothetical protein [Dendronalium sp. ChiSLP03b]|uniref:hypothetical protein n=1 Tax=Dendronalium sp. ChiSLP03b TaxID=3075381 RepID=UPI002AD1DDFF|nr:hypothetical protein [Dendronalium sp. ChiSLP03b]MDZ8208440.1 hypothetical protein [Dendronalium sp. ChiSLP03b]
MKELLKEQKLGVVDFLKFIYNGHPEYSLIAVKAPIEETVKAFIELSQAQKIRERMDYKTFRMKEINIASREIHWEQNLPLRSSEEYEELEWAIPFVQVRGNEWTVILRSLFNLTGDEIQDVRREAKELSARFETKAITLMEEDTSVAIEYEFFNNGERWERFVNADDTHFESKFREKPDINFDWCPEDDEDYDSDQEYDVNTEPRVQFVNTFFTELGIYLPACYPVTDNGKPTLAVEKRSENTIERADWVCIKETLAKEEPKQLDEDDAE